MTKKLTKDDVLNLARLSKLELNEDELKQYIIELNAILEYVEQLSEVDTTGLVPTAQVTGLTNVMRKDVVKKQLVSTEELLRIAPDTKENYIRAKRMI